MIERQLKNRMEFKVARIEPILSSLARRHIDHSHPINAKSHPTCSPDICYTVTNMDQSIQSRNTVADDDQRDFDDESKYDDNDSKSNATLNTSIAHNANPVDARPSYTQSQRANASQSSQPTGRRRSGPDQSQTLSQSASNESSSGSLSISTRQRWQRTATSIRALLSLANDENAKRIEASNERQSVTQRQSRTSPRLNPQSPVRSSVAPVQLPQQKPNARATSSNSSTSGKADRFKSVVVRQSPSGSSTTSATSKQSVSFASNVKDTDSKRTSPRGSKSTGH